MTLLNVIAIGIMLAVAYAHAREGFYSAATILFASLIAGLVAFGFYEPLVETIGDLGGFEDAICLTGLFCVTLGILRYASISLVPHEVQTHPHLHQLGGGALGLVTGYLAAGFLLCVWQTLPWHPNFMGFEPGSARRAMPPDQNWLRLVRQANRGLAGSDARAFTEQFEAHYAKWRTQFE
jgi:hypothetical protein